MTTPVRRSQASPSGAPVRHSQPSPNGRRSQTPPAGRRSHMVPLYGARRLRHEDLLYCARSLHQVRGVCILRQSELVQAEGILRKAERLALVRLKTVYSSSQVTRRTSAFDDDVSYDDSGFPPNASDGESSSESDARIATPDPVAVEPSDDDPDLLHQLYASTSAEGLSKSDLRLHTLKGCSHGRLK